MNLYQTIVLLCVTISSMATHHRERSKKQQTKSCSDQFPELLNKCLESFIPHIDMYTGTKPKDPFVHHIFIQHVCRNYEKMLLCVHVVLTNCKTTDNIEQVQDKLSKDWVLQINIMCNINSNSSKDVKNQHKENSKDNRYKNRETNIHINGKNRLGQNEDSHLDNEDLTKSALFNKLLHSSNTDLDIITMFVFRSAPKTTKQIGSMPNSLDGTDKQKLDSRQKYQTSNLLHLFISLGGTGNKDVELEKYSFLAQKENSSDKNGTKRHFSWQVVVLITAANYLYSVLR